MRRFWLAAFGLLFAAGAAAQGCGDGAPAVQVLGSGRTGHAGGSAANGALLWSGGVARVLVNAGPGVALRLAETGASPVTLDVVLLGRLDIGSSADLAPIAEAAWTRERNRSLPVYGPRGNNLMPSTVSFVRTLFDPVRGAWRYRGDLLAPLERGGYKLRPFDVTHKAGQAGGVFRTGTVSASALPGVQDGVPTLAWRIELDGKAVVFAGDLRDAGSVMERFVHGAGMLVVDEPPANGDNGAEPRAVAAIASLAQKAGARELLVMRRRSPPADELLAPVIRKTFDGAVNFAVDLGCYPL